MLDDDSPAIGIVVNPVSGRDVRRLAARAGTSTPADKRNQVERVIVGAAAAGAERVVLVRDPFRISDAAVEALGVPVGIELLDLGAACRPGDTERAVDAMRERGCGALVVLGGDGTNRRVARAWPDANLVPISTGTNNVFPVMVEATTAGAAAGLVAAGAVPIDAVSARCKLVRTEIEGESDDLALIDAALLVDDSLGNLMPFDPACLRRLVLARAEPAAVGMSPIGGLLQPALADDDFGIEVECSGKADGGPDALLAPTSPGLYREVGVIACRRLALEEPVELRGPGLLAFDGDRERALAPGQRAVLRVSRSGPHVVDVPRALAEAAARGSYRGRPEWHDARARVSVSCC